MASSPQDGQPQNVTITANEKMPQICQLCHERIQGIIIKCYSCGKPHHETCTQPPNAHEAWSCTICKPRDTRNSRPASRSGSSTRLSRTSRDSYNSMESLKLRRLEEERELAKQRDQEYLSKKYQLLEEQVQDTFNEQTGAPNQLADNEYPERSNNEVTNIITFAGTMPNTNTQPGQTNNTSVTLNNAPRMASAVSNPPINTHGNTNNTYSFQPTHFATQDIPLHSTHYQQSSINMDYTNMPRQQQSMTNPSQSALFQNFSEPLGISGRKLTTDQLHARQTVPKDLPLFTGRPEEYPLYSSTFDWSTTACGLTDAENLVRLQRSLRGEALEAVERILVHPSCVAHAISTLKVLYGQPEKILYSLKNKIKSLPNVNPNKMETIINFAIQVKGLLSTIEACGLTDELNNSSLLQELLSKLPPYYRLNWGKQKLHLQQFNKRANLTEFSNWMFEIGLSASAVNVETDSPSEMNQRKHKSAFINTHAEQNSKKCQICSGECNNASSCHKFMSADRNQRWVFVKQYELCKHCLRKHRGVCYNKNRICTVEGCERKHHYLLHGPNKNVNTPPAPTKEASEEDYNNNGDDNTSVQNLNTHDTNKQKILFKIIPIRIFGKNSVVSTFAFLDDGSSVSLIEKDILEELNLKGETEELCLKWTSNVERLEKDSQHLHINVCGNESKMFSLDVRSVKKLMLPKQSLDYSDLCAKFKYLKGLPIESYTAASPKVLIGLNGLNITISTKIKKGGMKEPVAIKTALGWTIFGPCGGSQLTPYNLHICECIETDNKIHQLVKHFYNIESLGINCHRLPVTREDERSLQLLDKFTKQREDGHYESCLLWQFEEMSMPDSYEMAKKRLICLENKLLKDEKLFHTFVQTIESYADKGFISKIDKSSSGHQRVWYLPTFPVFNKNKPGKCRIVWDAAAKSHGVSLNSMLHKGPDLLSSLLAILYKFREKSVAICGDIEQMFHQVYICEEDRQAQRFLWRNCDRNREPDIYIMNVMVFGASCSPSISQYVKNTNASKFEIQFPRAADAVKNNHYVDDFLYSTDTVAEAIQIAKEVHYIQSCAGFKLRNWCSNKENVLQSLEEPQQKDKQLTAGSDKDIEKVLGVFWNPTQDIILFKISPHIIKDIAACSATYVSKRQILKILMTVYDPLGLIGNFMMYLKIILQEIWKSGVGWDEPIKDDQLVKWNKWLDFLPNLEKVNIQRCYLKQLENYNDANIQLHTFVDASENGYAAVAYLRISTENNIVCSLVGSKTRVAPLRMTSIPRLELMAALIGARFANNIIKSHSIQIQNKFFWSDSKTVISWLTHSNKKYHQFVALRISEILETTELENWHWIPGKLNVADEATKWAKRPDISPNGRWFKGPEFLLTSENEWPEETVVLQQPDTEIKEYVYVISNDIPVIDANRFSKWKRLLRACAYVLRFITLLKKLPAERGELTSKELFRAELLLFKIAQQEAYSEEINTIKLNKSLPKSSPLYRVSPKIDDIDILHVDSRLDRAYLSDESKYPIILPRTSRITFLLVTHFHTIYNHLHHETAVNEIRQRYYIPHLRALLKTAVRKCQSCRIRKAVPTNPQMAVIPEARLAAFCPPFTYTGVDYFGPILVTVGRHKEKRYGALFTCLTIRAVHIEIVHTLNTSSCIMAIRNFMARRGMPREFYSDNGTNFVSAEREIREAVQEVDRNELVRCFTTTTTEWKFNPPAAPHMGGAWERLVRSVKTVFYNITVTRAPSDELLRGMLSEVENIINSRPLTYVPIEHENAEALTPNHFLLGRSNGIKPLAIYDDSGFALQHNWLCAQQYAEMFWRRWVTEYLPTLTLRSKWHEKTKPLQVGDLVIVVDPSSPRNVWLRGKVLETSVAKDGQVRKARILTPSGILLRPATKLAVLNVASN